jgi:phosphatidylinositol 4-phosphatase
MIIDYKKPLYRSRFLWISGQVLLSQQKGVYRVNCIDCLDRTNVVQASNIAHLAGLTGSRIMQSAFARHVLNRQLLVLALNPSGPTMEMDVVFNDGTTPG